MPYDIEIQSAFNSVVNVPNFCGNLFAVATIATLGLGLPRAGPESEK